MDHRSPVRVTVATITKAELIDRPRHFSRAIFLFMNRQFKIPLLVLIALVASVTGLSAEIINSMCPVTPEEPVESWITTDYEGKTVGFCCKSCLRKFNANPNAYIQNLGLEQVDSSFGGDAHTSEHAEHTNPLSEDSFHQHSYDDHSENFEHDHATDHASSETFNPWVLLGKLHVLSVHLPIALLPIAAILEFLGIYVRSRKLSFAARTNFTIGATSALVAASLGWIAAEHANYTGELAEVLFVHRWLGVAVASISLLGVLGISIQPRTDKIGITIYRFAIFFLLIFVPITAHFGGSLIYGKDYLF